jgi:hypothetical protein
MKKAVLGLTAVTALATVGIRSEEPSKILDKHHFSIGPTVMKPNMKFEGKYSSRFNPWMRNLNQVFYGLKFGYEYLSEDAFYFGADLHSGIHQCAGRGDWSLGKMDLRFGYTLPFFSIFDKHWDVSIFTGFGGYAWKDAFGDSYDTPFWHLGARTRIITGQNMDLGLHVKWLAFQDTHETNRAKFFGAEVGLPFTFKPLQSGWEFSLAPHFVHMCRTSSQNVMHYELKATRRF